MDIDGEIEHQSHFEVLPLDFDFPKDTVGQQAAEPVLFLAETIRFQNGFHFGIQIPIELLDLFHWQTLPFRILFNRRRHHLPDSA